MKVNLPLRIVEFIVIGGIITAFVIPLFSSESEEGAKSNSVLPTIAFAVVE